jgi:tetratricopeptide (TPR) repeat protein
VCRVLKAPIGDVFLDTQAYQNAKDALKAQDYKAAERAFKVAFDSIDESDEYYNNIQSYYGLVQVLNSNDNGLLLCRDAASNEMHDGYVFLNLACAEWQSDNRKRAIGAIRHGIKIDADHAQLNRACARLDCRKKCCFPFLSRNHKLNRLFGRLMRRPSGPPPTVHNLLF